MQYFIERLERLGFTEIPQKEQEHKYRQFVKIVNTAFLPNSYDPSVDIATLFTDQQRVEVRLYCYRHSHLFGLSRDSGRGLFDLEGNPIETEDERYTHTQRK